MSEQPAPPPEKRKPRRPIAQVAAENSPLIPTAWDPADALALQRLAAGTANALEQKRALEWILRVSGINEEPYRPGGEDGRRDTDFALGKASVGRQIVKLVKINLSRVRGNEYGEHG